MECIYHITNDTRHHKCRLCYCFLNSWGMSLEKFFLGFLSSLSAICCYIFHSWPILAIIRHPWPSLFFLGLEGVDCWTNHAKDTFKTFKATYMHVTLRILNLCSCLELQKYIEPLIAFKVSKHCKYTSTNGSQVTACRLSRSLQINFKT